MRGSAVLLTAGLAAGSIAATSAVADAGIAKIYLEAHGGGMVGKGTGGDLVNNDVADYDEAFYQNAGPLAYGGQIGAQFLFLEANVQHHQYKGFSDDPSKPKLSTWTQFAMGMRFEVDVGQQTPEEKKASKGMFVELGWNVGFGIGTGQQVDPPLSNDELTDKGFFATGRIGIGTHLSSVFDVGLAVPVTYGYYFKSGDGAVANDLSTHYQSAQIEALLYLRANIRLL